MIRYFSGAGVPLGTITFPTQVDFAGPPILSLVPPATQISSRQAEEALSRVLAGAGPFLGRASNHVGPLAQQGATDYPFIFRRHTNPTATPMPLQQAALPVAVRMAQGDPHLGDQNPQGILHASDLGDAASSGVGTGQTLTTEQAIKKSTEVGSEEIGADDTASISIEDHTSRDVILELSVKITNEDGSAKIESITVSELLVKDTSKHDYLIASFDIADNWLRLSETPGIHYIVAIQGGQVVVSRYIGNTPRDLNFAQDSIGLLSVDAHERLLNAEDQASSVKRNGNPKNSLRPAPVATPDTAQHPEVPEGFKIDKVTSCGVHAIKLGYSNDEKRAAVKLLIKVLPWAHAIPELKTHLRENMRFDSEDADAVDAGDSINWLTYSHSGNLFTTKLLYWATWTKWAHDNNLLSLESFRFWNTKRGELRSVSRSGFYGLTQNIFFSLPPSSLVSLDRMKTAVNFIVYGLRQKLRLNTLIGFLQSHSDFTYQKAQWAVRELQKLKQFKGKPSQITSEHLVAKYAGKEIPWVAPSPVVVRAQPAVDYVETVEPVTIEAPTESAGTDADAEGDSSDDGMNAEVPEVLEQGPADQDLVAAPVLPIQGRRLSNEDLDVFAEGGVEPVPAMNLAKPVSASDIATQVGAALLALPNIQGLLTDIPEAEQAALLISALEMLGAKEAVQIHAELYKAGVVDAAQRQAVIKKFELQGHPRHLPKAVAFIKANPGLDYSTLRRDVLRLVVGVESYDQYELYELCYNKDIRDAGAIQNMIAAFKAKPFGLDGMAFYLDNKTWLAHFGKDEALRDLVISVCLLPGATEGDPSLYEIIKRLAPLYPPVETRMQAAINAVLEQLAANRIPVASGQTILSTFLG